MVINREEDELARTFQTSMPPGIYCNVIEGELTADGTGCSGPTITVDEDGKAEITVPPIRAAAIHAGARLP